MRWQTCEPVRMEVDGATLEAHCFGPAPEQATTIVLLHEGLGCARLWREFPRQLVASTGCGVFAWSRSGYGQSSPAKLPRCVDYMTQEAREVLPVVLERIGFRRGVLLGHSDGASIAAIYAGQVGHPGLRGIVLLAPHFFTEPGGLASIAHAKIHYVEGDLRARLAKYHADPDNTFYGWCDAWLNPQFKQWNIEDVLDTIRVPVLAIQGEDDQYGTLAQLEPVQSRVKSNTRIEIIKQCKHEPHLEHSERTLALVAEFIDATIGDVTLS